MSVIALYWLHFGIFSLLYDAEQAFLAVSHSVKSHRFGQMSRRYSLYDHSCPWNIEIETRENSRHVIESGFRNPVNFPCGIRNTAQGFRISLTIGIWNPSSAEKESGIQYLESGIPGVESRIQNCVGFPHIGRENPFLRENNCRGTCWNRSKTTESAMR